MYRASSVLSVRAFGSSSAVMSVNGLSPFAALYRSIASRSCAVRFSASMRSRSATRIFICERSNAFTCVSNAICSFSMSLMSFTRSRIVARSVVA